MESALDITVGRFDAVDAPLVIKQDEIVIDSSVVLKPKKILIVDDQSFNIQALTVILKYSLGITNPDHIVSALDGSEAVQKVMADVKANYG